jgi:hypothetical protein
MSVAKIADHLIANGVRLEEKQATSNASEKFASDNHVGGKWIPVTERLPDDSVPSAYYLCYWNGRIRCVKYWRTQKEFVLMGKTVKVTHWMPLPSTEGLE